ncbi:hypothetical protein [Streptomyces galbus]|uniref:hypothetical protein n=1 Tax=Streptomyces galbus TaxID=33898 RepID=UPI003EBCDC8B
MDPLRGPGQPAVRPLSTTALCVYDTRTAGRAVVEAARRAHPGSGVYTEPARLAAELDAVPLPPPPPGAERLARPDVPAVRAWAERQGMPEADAELFGTAVGEAAALGRVTGALLWGEAPGCVCELALARRVDDPLAGFVPPAGTDLAPGQGSGTPARCAPTSTCAPPTTGERPYASSTRSRTRVPRAARPGQRIG